MTLKKGWLGRQFTHVTNDVQAWPEWMKREAGFGEHRRIQSDESERQAALQREVRSENTATPRQAKEY